MPRQVPEAVRPAWERRDLDAEAHRAAYTGLIMHAGWPWPELADALYEWTVQPHAWAPYPDSQTTLDPLPIQERPSGFATLLQHALLAELPAPRTGPT
jgi:hypothetical protein